MKPFTQPLILICLLGAAMAPLRALGDAMMVSKAMTASTIAEFYVDQQGIRVEIEGWSSTPAELPSATVSRHDLGASENVLQIACNRTLVSPELQVISSTGI